jgi:hypothetical protein
MCGFSSLPRTPFRLLVEKPFCTALVVACLTAGSSAFAHATLVLGTLATDPTPPRADAPFTLSIRLLDLTQVPVEDARVLAEFRRPGQGRPITAPFHESDTPGVYETALTLPRTGSYTLLLRDQTYRREEAQATLTFPVGRAPAEPLEFVFPPTATGAGVWTWIGLLIGLPLLAAGIVTTLVLLRGGKGEAAATANGASGVSRGSRE